MLRILSVLAILAAGQLGEARKFIISNQCKAPVWAAYMRESGGAATVKGKSGVGMWLQASGQKDEVEVPEDFAHGRFWAATGCNAQGTGCKIGGCPNGVCDGSTVGTSGATLAEFTLPGTETFDISITDGYNIPMAITPTGGTGGEGECRKVTCGVTTDLLTQCDPSLAFPYGSETVWSCFNPCTAGVQYQKGAITPFNFLKARSCCPVGEPECHTDVDVPFFDQMKATCDDGFVYPLELTMNHECKSPSEYLIEFCPGGKGIGASPSGNAPINQCAGPGGAIVGGGATGTNSDGGGTFAGLPEGAGDACDGKAASAATSGSSETALTGAIPGAGTAAGSASASAMTQASASADAGTGSSSAAAESPADVAESSSTPAPAASASATADVAPAPVASSAAASVSAPAAAASTTAACKGRHCRNGSGGRSKRGSEAARLARAVAERDGECAA